MPAKPKALTEVQFLALLDKVLAKIMSDLNLRSAIQEEVAKEIRVINNLAAFTKFAEKGSVPDTAPETVAELQDQLAATFGGDAKVEVTSDEETWATSRWKSRCPTAPSAARSRCSRAGAGRTTASRPRRSCRSR